ncbi:hypothetical protein DV738_g1198, partial [Chaetothyriales sp. CBS 135597]
MQPLLETKKYGRSTDKVYGKKRQLPQVRQAHRALFGGADNDEEEIEKSFAKLRLNGGELELSEEQLPKQPSEEDDGECARQIAVRQPAPDRRPARAATKSSAPSSTSKRHRSQDIHHRTGSIHLSPSEQRQLAPLLSHPSVHSHVVSFPAFSSRLLSKFDVRKSGEGSFSECLLLKHKENPSDMAVVKIIPFDLSESASSQTLGSNDDHDDQESTITNSTVSAVLREIRVLSALSAYHGFAAVRSCHVVRGPWHEGFLEAYHAFRKDHPDLALNPLPSERWDDKMIYGVIEMDNAGSDLEKLVKPSAFQVYDAFWMTTVLLAVVERELEFEHRDLHMSNILYRERIPGQGLDISHDVVSQIGSRTQGHGQGHESDVLLGLSNIKITIIDYTMSRLRLHAGDNENSRDEDDQDVLFNPDSVWSNTDPKHARTGLRIHRLVSRHHTHEDSVSSKWHAHIPVTTTLWLAHILHQLLRQAGSRPRHVPGSSPQAKKLQTRIWKQLREVLETIDRDDPTPLIGGGGGAVELLNTAMEKSWICERDIQVFKDRLNDELL